MCLKAADYVNCYQYHLNTKSPQSDLRNYGPLKIDWSMWKSRGEKHIVPALNQDGKLLYVALNCTTRFINVKADTGKWKNWLMPKQPFEHRLIYDFCKNKSTP